jgi:erythronate-4-phosphate dehydrogenase
VRIATPHIAGYTLDGKIRGTYMLYQALCRHLDLPDANPLQDYLPQPSVCGLTLGTAAGPLELMRLLYDPWRDDRALRATLCLPDAERRLAFDRLRKEYPVRREFATLRLTEARDPVLANELAALGFAVDLA